MHGNILSNHQILSLVKDKILEISPWNRDSLRLVDYPLLPSVVFEKEGDNHGSPKLKRVHTFGDTSDAAYEFPPNSYRVVEIDEHIVIPEGIVGYFTPASGLIERGFGITAGRIQHPFGFRNKKVQKVRFGITNLVNQVNVLSSEERLAHIHFVDLRSLKFSEYEISNQEDKIFEMRTERQKRAADDGPHSVIEE